jgi:hypothetical protein
MQLPLSTTGLFTGLILGIASVTGEFDAFVDTAVLEAGAGSGGLRAVV